MGDKHAITYLSTATCHLFVLKQRQSMSVTLTHLVRETAEDNQRRTNDVLQIPRCVTFDHVRYCRHGRLSSRGP